MIKDCSSEKLRIKPLSSSLFMDAFTTMPIEPCYLEVTLNYEGLKIPDYDNRESFDQQNRVYLRVCREKNIIPFSMLKMDFNNNGDAVPKLEVRSKEPFKDMAVGGRYNVVFVAANRKKAIDSTLKIIPNFLDRNYQVTQCVLNGRGIELISRNSGIELNGQIEEVEKLEDWFLKLKRRYNDNLSKEQPDLEWIFNACEDKGR